MSYQILPRSEINGVFKVPGDKSISHRALLLAPLAHGKSIIKNLNPGLDVMTTLSYLKESSVKYEVLQNEIWIYGEGEFPNPPKTFNCGNSGTTLSLLMGLVQRSITFDGDESLKSRSFQTQIEALESFGHSFRFLNKRYHLPFYMIPAASFPRKIYYKMTEASAQLKSMLLLSVIQRSSELHLVEKIPTRNHTENILRKMGGKRLLPFKLTIPGDFSLAAYFITAALIARKARIVIKDVSLNPTRLGFYEIVRKMGGEISLQYKKKGEEPVGDIEVKSSQLKGVEVPKKNVSSFIDEIPCLAILGLVAQGKTKVTGAMRLRNKECDRVQAICENLNKCGADIKELNDGFVINGNKALSINECLKGFQDHRMIMALSLLSFIYEKPFFIDSVKRVDVSYPSFFKEFK